MDTMHRSSVASPGPSSQAADPAESRLDAAQALAKMMIHELRNPLSVVKGYGEMMARDELVADDGRFRGLMEGVERLGTVVDCVTAMMQQPELAAAQADVGSTMTLAAGFVQLTHRPEPDIEVDIARNVPAVAMRSVDFQHLTVGVLLAVCRAAGARPCLRVSARFARSGPSEPDWGASVVGPNTPAEWHRTWPMGRAAVTVVVENRGRELDDGGVPSMVSAQGGRLDHRYESGLDLEHCAEIAAAAGGTITAKAREDGVADIMVALPALTNDMVALWAEREQPTNMETWSG